MMMIKLLIVRVVIYPYFIIHQQLSATDDEEFNMYICIYAHGTSGYSTTCTHCYSDDEGSLLAHSCFSLIRITDEL